MGGVYSSEAGSESDAAAATTSELPPPSNSACDALLAKLDELMDFLRFAKLPTANFHGVVTFMFRASNEDKNDIACIRTVDMRRDLEVLETPLSAEDPFARDVAVVHVSLADFLYMYSGEASAGEIAGMCMSGRVSVPWSAYGKLKAFAECFDFATERWDAYYAQQAPSSASSSVPPCAKSCCRSSSRADIDADWMLVSDASTASSCSSGGGGEWQVVSDCKCFALPPERRAEMERVVGAQQLDDWLAQLWHGHIRRSNAALQQNVRKSLLDLKELTGKLFVSLEA